jgi:CspA family cold shock protein|tara:strand:- start:159 stop:368 length:210 start_codon:yes stop_codon:yes gene_type:complete
MRLKEKVKFFNPKIGYGFIEREDKENDILVHMSAVKDSSLKFLNESEELTFEIEDGPKGPCAVKLEKTS